MKLCKDCKHARIRERPEGFWAMLFSHPSIIPALCALTNVVNGNGWDARCTTPCELERGLAGKCGPQAGLWEPKD